MNTGRTPFDLTTTERDGLAVVAVVGDLDCATAPGLSQALASLAVLDRVIVVDLSRTEFMDCAGTAPLVDAHTRQQDLGGELILDSPRGEVSKVIELTQLDTFITIIGRPAPADLRQQEMGRLDAMADVFRSKQDLDGDEIAQRLRAVDRLREMLLAD